MNCECGKVEKESGHVAHIFPDELSGLVAENILRAEEHAVALLISSTEADSKA